MRELLFADDSALVAHSAEEMQKIVDSSNVGSYQPAPAAPWRNSGEFLRMKVKVTMSNFGSAPAPVENEEHNFWSFLGGILPVKCRHLADRSCTSGAAWWTSHELKLHKFVRLIV